MRLQHLQDSELVELIGDSSSEALAEAYRRHSGPVYGLALRLVREQAKAEDVTQEVFLRLWNRPEAFDPDRGSLRSYLLSHAHGRSIDLIRSEGARRNREEREGRKAPVAGPSLEEEVMDMARAEQLRDALATLSDNERSAIELAYFGGYTYREVAEILGEPEGTVKSRIRIGLKRLHTRLAGVGLVAAG
jgi:RNA polymerase sigma-70 factor (ECF subfamily)